MVSSIGNAIYCEVKGGGFGYKLVKLLVSRALLEREFAMSVVGFDGKVVL